MKLFLNCLDFLLIFSISVLAQIPKTMSYQGVLADTSGNAVADGNYNLTFKIYDVSGGGTELWMETQTLPVVDGIFNAILGSVTPLNLAFDQPYWLGVSVEGGVEFSPRIELTSVPYSLEPDSGSGSGGDGHSLDAADGDPVDAVYVDNDGRVGIGTTAPVTTLSIVNDDESATLSDFTDSLNRAGIHILTQYTAGAYTPGLFWSTSDNEVGKPKAGIWLHEDDFGTDMYMGTSNIYASGITNTGFVLNQDGTVGIGTVDPLSNTKLHVESHDLYSGYFNGGLAGVAANAIEPGPGHRFGVRAFGQNGDGQNFGVSAIASGGTSSYGIYGSASGGSSNNYGVYASGDLAYTGNLINASDAKLKKNIHPLTGSLNKLMQLKPKTFNFTSDEQYAHMNLPAGEHYGLIAQEVEQVLPQLVSDNSHPSAAAIRGEKSNGPSITYKGLNSMELIPILIEAVQEQQTTIERLQEENQKQQEEINKLRSEIDR